MVRSTTEKLVPLLNDSETSTVAQRSCDVQYWENIQHVL